MDSVTELRAQLARVEAERDYVLGKLVSDSVDRRIGVGAVPEPKSQEEQTALNRRVRDQFADLMGRPDEYDPYGLEIPVGYHRKIGRGEL